MDRQLCRTPSVRCAAWLMVATMVVPLLAGCAPSTATPEPTTVPPTDTPAPTLAPAFAVTGTLTSAPNAFMNVGGGLRHFPAGDPNGLLAIEINASEVAASAGLAITVTLPISCPGTVDSPFLEVSDNEGTVTSTLDKVVEGLYQAVIRSDEGGGEALFGRLCQPDGATAHVMAYWECNGESDELNVGSLICGNVDLTGLEDPKGHTDGPFSNCPDLPGIQTTLVRVNSAGMVPGSNGCDIHPADDVWQWSATPPVAAAVPVVTAMPTLLTPQYNPLLTNVQGFFAWDAPHGSCYYVKAVNPAGCTWYSQLFGVEQGVPVIGLNVSIISSAPNCKAITSPCAVTPTTMPTATPTP